MDFEKLSDTDNVDNFDKQDLIEEEFNKFTTKQVKSYKIGRNNPCPCGSGKKYKKCCDRVTPEKSKDHYDQKLKDKIKNINKYGEKKDIKNALEVAIEADKDYPMEYAYSELAGIFYSELGNFEAAEQYLLKHYRIVKDDILNDSAIQLIYSLIKNGKHEKAENISSNLILNRDNANLYMLNGIIKLKLDKNKSGYRTLVEGYKLTDNNLLYLNDLINILIESKLTYKGLKLFDDNYNRFKQIENDSEIQIREFVELSLDNIYILNNKNINTKEYKEYLNKTLQVLEILNFNKALTEKDMRKIRNIITNQYDVPLFLTRFFNNYWLYDYAIENDKLLYSFCCNKNEIAISLAGFCYNNQYYIKAAHYYKLVLGANFIKLKGLEEIKTYIKNYILTLKKIDNANELGKLYELFKNTLKENPVKIIISCLSNLNSIQHTEIIEYIKINLNLNLEEKISFLDYQLANLVFDLKLIKNPTFDNQSLDWIEKLLAEYKEYDTEKFIYQYTKWLLDKRDNRKYDRNIEEIIKLDSNSYLSAYLKCFITIKLVDPNIILNNSFNKDVLNYEDLKRVRSFAKIKKEDYSPIENMLETDYDIFSTSFAIISQLLDGEEISQLLKEKPELINKYFKERDILDMFKTQSSLN